MKAIIWEEENMGMKFETLDIPSDLQDKSNKLREQLLETAAEASEELMDEYLTNGDLPMKRL